MGLIFQTYFPRAVYISTPLLLAALELQAIFTNGAYFIGSMTLCIIGAWSLLAIITLASLKYGPVASMPGPVASPSGTATSPSGSIFSLISKPLTATAILPVALFFIFWVWTGVSIFWSIAGSETWREFNRTGGYLAFLLIGLSIGTNTRLRKIVPWLFAGSAVIAAVYGLGPRVFPSVIDNIEDLGRISVPVGYANAQGILLSMFIPVALYFSAPGKENRFLQLVSVMAAELLFLCLFFTVSRGALYTLIVGLLICFILVPSRLRSFVSLLLVLMPVVAIGWWSNGQAALMQNQMPMEMRLAAAADLRAYILLGLAFTVILFIVILLMEEEIPYSRKARKITGAVVLSLIILSTVAGVTYFVSSKESFSQWTDQQFEAFTAERSEGDGAERLLSISSARRWQLWQEAIENWQEHKIAGTGAQSFPLTHLMLREEGTPFVKQPHGLPFRLLSELRLVGLLLMGAFVALTLTLNVRNLFAIKDRRFRDLPAPCLP